MRRPKKTLAAITGATVVAAVLAFQVNAVASDESSGSSKEALIAESGRPLFAADDGVEATADQDEVADRITHIQTPVGEKPSDGVPLQFAEGIVGFTGSPTKGYTVVVGKDGDTQAAIDLVLEGTSSEAASWLSVRVADHTTEELTRIWREVRAFKWSSRDPGYALDVDAAAGRIQVTADQATLEKDRARLQELGGDALELVVGGTLQVASRTNDSAPHWGGAAVRKGGQTSPTCSTGFTVKTGGGTKHGLTAGHCGSNGSNFYATSFYGTMVGKSGYPEYDMARLSTSTYQNRIYTDGADNFTNRLVTGANDGAVGQSVCTSGMVSKSICGITIQSLASTACVSGERICRTYLGKGRKTSQRPATNGDSGGPVYLRNTAETRATVKGIIVVVDNDSLVYWERYQAIANHLNVTAVTSP